MSQADAMTTPPSAPAKKRSRAWLTVITALCLLTGLVIWWYAGLRNQFLPDNFGVVEPGRIYRSAQISSRVIRGTLADNNIKVIVDLSHENSSAADAEQKIAAELGIERITIPGLGGKGTGDPNAYPEAIRAIVAANKQGKAVLVHCQSGSQRTGGVIAVYRMLVEGKSEAEALAEARKFHHRDSQNPYLVPFIEKHLPEWKAQLQADGIVAAGIPRSE
jgi:protein tyrosine/serine phosphatase